MATTALRSQLRVYPSNRSQARQALTLVEVLVVVATLGVLVSILLPAISSVRASVDTMHCGRNQRQMLVALFAYCGDFEDVLPGTHLHGTLNFDPITGRTTDGLGCKAGGDPANGCPNTPFCNVANIHEAITWFGYNTFNTGSKNTDTLTGSHHISGGDTGHSIAQETVTCPSVIRRYRKRLSLMQSGFSIGYPYNTAWGTGPAWLPYDRPRLMTQINSPSRYVIFADGAVARWRIIGGVDIMHMPVTLPRQDFSNGASPPRLNAQGIGANHREKAVVSFADGHVETVPITNIMKELFYIYDH